MTSRLTHTVLLVASVLVCLATTVVAQPDPPPVENQVQWALHIASPANDNGKQLEIGWKRTPKPVNKVQVLLLRREAVDSDDDKDPHKFRTGLGMSADRISLDFLLSRGKFEPRSSGFSFSIQSRTWEVGSQHGYWTVVASVDADPAKDIIDKVEASKQYVYALITALPTETPDKYFAFIGDSIISWKVAPKAHWFNTDKLGYLALILVTGGGLFGFTWLAKRRTMFVRRIAGVDAIEDSIGRATEMGRPVLYVTGVDEAQDIQTIAGLLILGHVAKITAEYDTEIRVANAFPLTMVIAEEMVRQGYANAGRLDAHKPDNVMFITSEQFAFAAGVNGIIMRERPATNIYFGRFYGESLMLAETGFVAGAVQIAGTAELTQMPFFIAGCDYTLIGEELYATSAYLTREPDQMAQLKVGDMLKVIVALLVVIGVTFATLASNNIYPFTRFNLMEILFP
jgi:hypothetical protein